MEVGDVFDERLVDKINPPTDVMVAKRSVPLPRDVTSPLPRVSGPFHIVGAHGDEQEDQGAEVEVTDDMILESEGILETFNREEDLYLDDDDDEDLDYDPERHSSTASSGRSLIILVGYLGKNRDLVNNISETWLREFSYISL